MAGFKALLELKKREVEDLAKIVELLPIGGSVRVLRSFINASPGLPQTALSTASMVFSLGGLMMENEGNVEQLAEDLYVAYVENLKDAGTARKIAKVFIDPARKGSQPEENI